MQGFAGLGEAALPAVFRGIVGQGPKGLAGNAAVFDRHVLAGGQLVDALENRATAEGGPECEDLVQGFGVDGARDIRVGEKGLDFRGKQQPVAAAGVEQGPDAHAVPGQKEFLFAVVPDGQGELTVDFFQAGRPVFLIEVQEHLGVGIGGKAVAFLEQLRFEFDVVESLAVVDNPKGAVFVGDGLPPAFDPDNAEPDMAQTHMIVQVDAGLVGSAVADDRHHGDEFFP